MLIDGVFDGNKQQRRRRLALSASTTNYVEATRAGVVSKTPPAFTAGSIPPEYDRYRRIDRHQLAPINAPGCNPPYPTGCGQRRGHHRRLQFLTAAEARCQYLTTTGTLTGNRNVIVPNNWQGLCSANNSGAFHNNLQTSGGTASVAQGKRALLLADGTNVVRGTTDV